MSGHPPPCYGEKVARAQQKEFVQSIVDQYASEEANEGLAAKIYEDLSMQKHYGKLTMPFSVELVEDPQGLRPNYIEVSLDSKV